MLFEGLDVGEGLDEDGLVGGVDFLEEAFFDGHDGGSVKGFFYFTSSLMPSRKATAPLPQTFSWVKCSPTLTAAFLPPL